MGLWQGDWPKHELLLSFGIGWCVHSTTFDITKVTFCVYLAIPTIVLAIRKKSIQVILSPYIQNIYVILS